MTIARLALLALLAAPAAAAAPAITVGVGTERWNFAEGGLAECEIGTASGKPVVEIDAIDDMGTVLELSWSGADPAFSEAQIEPAGTPAWWTASNQASGQALRLEHLDGRAARFAARFTRNGTAEPAEADGTIEITCPG
jgi:hypothetical protein